MIKKTLGGDRLGSGNKMQTSMNNYERSTHDLGFTWRSTMSAGTLVPFLVQEMLPEDKMEIELNCDVLTHPTIGPLFGSFKVQLDLFKVPMANYNAMLHMNTIGIGREMSKVKLPQIKIEGNNLVPYCNPDTWQINPSSIFSYLNIRSLGHSSDEGILYVTREFNAIPYLGYFDIFYNYYSNKQEENAYIIHNDLSFVGFTEEPTAGEITDQDGNNLTVLELDPAGGAVQPSGFFRNEYETTFVLSIAAWDEDWADRVLLTLQTENTLLTETYTLNQWFDSVIWNGTDTLTCYGLTAFTYNGVIPPGATDIQALHYQLDRQVVSLNEDTTIKLTEFPLANINEMRRRILTFPQDGTPFVLNGNQTGEDTVPIPYRLPLRKQINTQTFRMLFSATSNQEGLLVKTYQSDLFNNWVDTEYIDGDTGVNSISKVIITSDADGDYFTIDELNLSNRIHKMLMRIAVSDGTYNDWQEVTYNSRYYGRTETPVYVGGLIKELTFQEVVSNTGTSQEPLGSLAGRGRLTSKHKGGKVTVKASELTYLMGIVSITPRVDYSQGNRWDTNLKTIDDFHKPQLDRIGFQDFLSDQVAGWSTHYNGEETLPTFTTIGKHPAWINYMTNVNMVKGNFADQAQQMFMTLNRRYELGSKEIDGDTDRYNYFVNDLTTYIDPAKFNHIFADTRLDSQNFWVQIKVDNKARRQMSAKLMPNL